MRLLILNQFNEHLVIAAPSCRYDQILMMLHSEPEEFNCNYLWKIFNHYCNGLGTSQIQLMVFEAPTMQ